MRNYILFSRTIQLNFLIAKPSSLGSRLLLTQAYQCETAWAKRLENPILQSLKMDQHFIETDKKFNTKKKVSGIEIDLFANNISESAQLDELEHLLYRFRRTKQCTEIMDSTVAAVVRIFLKFKEYDSLLRILNDYENYGIFPDLYNYNILMDTFLEEKKYSEALEIAFLMMLQEDFSNEVSCLLAMHSCQEFLNNCSLKDLNTNEAVDEETETTKNDEEEEETFVRVPFLRNPWFDDHFDLVEPKHLIGKTLFLAGRQMRNDILGRTYAAVGLAMYEKWNILLDMLNSYKKTGIVPALMSEGVEKVKEYLNESPVERKAEIEGLLEELQKNNQIKTGSYLEELKHRIKSLSELEQKDIDAQLELFKKWEQDRINAFDKHSLFLEKGRRLKVIEEKKEYLFWKEKLLFFFENEKKNISEFKKVKEIEEMIKSKIKTEDTYIPPEIIKKPTTKRTKYEKLAMIKRI